MQTPNGTPITEVNDDEELSRHWWFSLADEASADDFDRADFDSVAMAMADRFADRHHLPKFDAIADVDKATQMWVEHQDDVTRCSVCFAAASAEREAALARATEVDEMRRELDEARAAYEEFQQHWSAVGRMLRTSSLPQAEWQYQRVDAYPSWEGTRDVGSGVDMLGWMDEVEHFIEGEPDEDDDRLYGDDARAYGGGLR